MNPIRRVRTDLGLTQKELAEAIGMTQPNITFYEKGVQTMPPAAARKLIDFAASVGMVLTYEDIYDGPRPAKRRREARI